MASPPPTAADHLGFAENNRMQQRKDSPNATMTVAAKPKSRPAAVWVAKSELSKVLSEQKLQQQQQQVAEAGAPPGEKADPKTEEVSGPKGGDHSSSQGGGVVGGLSRQLSLSRLNAEAPAFVPKTSTPTSLVQVGQSLVLAQPVSMPVTIPQPVSESLVTAEPEEQSLSVSAKSSAALGDELRSQIVQQVEFYFSDANLPTDSYLMKFVKKDPEGFVPIPVIGSFRKMKQLTKSHAAIAAALRTSSKLVVNEDGKKVRRAEPLAESDLDDVQARTVVAENLPDDHSTQSLGKLFGTVGTVRMVKVCEPGSLNGGNNNTVMKISKADRIVSNKVHALVEYETVEQAEKAVAELTDQQNWRSGLHVRLLLRRMHPTNKYNNYNAKGKKHDATGEESTERAHDGEAQSDQQAETGTEGERESGVGTRRGAMPVRGRGRGRGRGRVNTSNGGGMFGSSPQISCSPLTEFVSKPPPGPRMPDGTRGFTFGRGKTSPAPTKISALVVT